MTSLVTHLTLGDWMQLMQLFIVIGGGFYFVGTMKTELRSLETAINLLREELARNHLDHEGRIRELEKAR